MYKMAVIGDKDSVLAFRAMGISVIIPKTDREIRDSIDSLAKDNYGIIFIIEEYAKKVEETIRRYDSRPIPAIVLIPSNRGTLNIGMKNIDKYVEKAIGSNIL